VWLKRGAFGNLKRVVPTKGISPVGRPGTTTSGPRSGARERGSDDSNVKFVSSSRRGHREWGSLDSNQDGQLFKLMHSVCKLRSLRKLLPFRVTAAVFFATPPSKDQPPPKRNLGKGTPAMTGLNWRSGRGVSPHRAEAPPGHVSCLFRVTEACC